MGNRIVTIITLVGLVFSVCLLLAKAGIHLPGYHQDYAPEQPIAYSHRLHAGELGIPCQYCHIGADKSRHAGIPAASTCMNCHKFVTSTFGAVLAEDERAKEAKEKPQPVYSEEIVKIYDALALTREKREPDPNKATAPIEWVRVHKLPDFVYFDHRPHVKAGVDCQKCHGPVEDMERMRQHEDLSMGWCVNCHRDAQINGVAGNRVNPSIDCSTCHY